MIEMIKMSAYHVISMIGFLFFPVIPATAPQDSLSCLSAVLPEDHVSVSEYRRKLEGNFVVRSLLLRPDPQSVVDSIGLEPTEYVAALRESLAVNHEFMKAAPLYNEVQPLILRDGLMNTWRELRDNRINEIFDARFSEETRRRAAQIMFQMSFCDLLINDTDLHSCLELTRDDINELLGAVLTATEVERIKRALHGF